MQEATTTELKSPSIIVRKSLRLLEVYDEDRLIRSMKAALGCSPEGDKNIEGDGRTPEGEFFVAVKNPKSKFYLSLGLSYPRKSDAERGFAGGLITAEERDEIAAAIDAGRMPPQYTPLGGEIYIHGGGSGEDWTRGCIAIEDAEMTDLFASIPVGTRVTILK
jgi:murein L,D-transpeptidase YafK